MESSSSDPPNKKPDGDDDDQDDRKPPPGDNSMTSVDRINALKSHRIRYEDAVDPNAERVTAIQPHDVILGRGKRLSDLEGNVRMRRIAEKYRIHYHSLRPSEKKSLIEMVYQEVVQDGGRFLIKRPDSEDSYLVVDEEIALEKVSNILRRRKSIVEQTDISRRVGASTSHIPAIQQAMSVGRSQVIGSYTSPGVTSLNQQVAIGNEVSRLPTNPFLTRLESVATLSINPLHSLASRVSLPHAFMSYHLLPNLTRINPSEQMRMTMVANIMEQERVVRDAMTIQQLNAVQDSRAASLYSQTLNRTAFFPPPAGVASLAHYVRRQSQPNNNDDAKGEPWNEETRDVG